MAEFTNAPQWQNEGVAPSEELKTNGFSAGYKPPASVFNYLFNKYGICISELQEDTNTKIGKSLAGQTVSPSSGQSVVANDGAEILNDYRERTFENKKIRGVYQMWAHNGNIASGKYAHAEGKATTATGEHSHAEGEETLASGEASHAEGEETLASGEASHAEGNQTTASGYCSHAEGGETLASGVKSHAENHETIASGKYAHAEGSGTSASGEASHAEGSGTSASGKYAHAGGLNTTATGDCSYATGHTTNAEGIVSHASGYKTKAKNYQTVTGKNNAENNGCSSGDDQSTESSIFIVGYGTSTTPANAFRVRADGKCMGTSSFASSGADYAEYFEWFDGNPNSEDRRGLFVTLDGDKIRLANANDDYIVGVISANPSVIGDVQSENWHGMYKKDVFGQPLTETVEVPESTDEKTGKVIPAHTVTRFVVNPDYNPNEEYTSREFRNEWGCVGLLGKLIVVDDGTCKVNGYCKVADGGKATKADTGYRVMKRLDDTHIQIMYR